MKTKLMLLSILAGLGTAAMAQEEGRKPPPPHHGAPHGPCKDDSASAECKTMREGMELRKAEWKARGAYFKAVKDKKDESARKADLLSAMDKLHAFEKAHVEDMAKAMASRPSRDTTAPGGKQCPRDPKGSRQGMNGPDCPRHGGPDGKDGPGEARPPRPEGPEGPGEPGMPLPPPPEIGEGR